MRFEDVEDYQFNERLQEVLDLRHCPDLDARLCEIAEQDESAAARLRAAEFIAAPPAIVMYPTANFADRILAQIHAEDAAEMRQRNLPIWKRKNAWYGGISLALAASVAIAIGMWNSQPEPSKFAAAPEPQPKPGITEPLEKTDSIGTLAATQPLSQSLQDISRHLDVREEKVEQLRSGLRPFRSTLNVTLHVIRATVPNRSHQPQPRQIDGKPSTSLVNTRWIA